MKIQNRATRRLIAGLFVTALLVPLGVLRPAFAHEAPCPYCGMAVTQDTATQDNEVALKVGRKRIEYKCVYCALTEAKSEYTGDLSILAPSEKKGEPIMLMRTGGQWSAMGATPYFVFNAPLKHKVCDVQARAFTTKEAAQAYIDANKDTLPSARLLSLDEMVQLASGANGAQAPTGA